MNEVVSIIMPMHNSYLSVKDSIESVLAQTYKEWELIIIDDYSEDNSKKIVSEYIKRDLRIKIVCLPNNLGVAEARNRGIQIAKGKYLAFLDSDDIWHQEKLERQIAFMQKHNIAFSYTQYRHFSSEDKNKRKIVDVKEMVTYQELLKGNIIGCLTVMLDREKIPNIYMSSIGHEDYILWLQILKQGYIAYGLKEDLAQYRISSNSLSGNKLRSAIWTWNVYKKIEHLSFIKALYYFIWYVVKGITKHL